MQDKARTIQQKMAACEAQLQDATFLQNCKAIVKNGFKDNAPLGTFQPTANIIDNILARACLLKLLSKAALNGQIKIDDPNWFQEAQEKLHSELNKPVPRLNQREENVHLFVEGCGMLLLFQFLKSVTAQTKLDFTMPMLAAVFYFLIAKHQREAFAPITATARTWLFPTAEQADAQQRQTLKTFVEQNGLMTSKEDLQQLARPILEFK